MQKTVLVFGSSGLVGSRFLELQKDNLELNAPNATAVDILDEGRVSEYINKSEAEFVINFAAFTQVEKAEEEKGNKEGLAYKLNATGAKHVANACKQANKRLIHVSTEYVFDGKKSDGPYTEQDKPNPVNWYGATKFFGEEFVLASQCLSTIVRISMPFSPYYQEKKDIARFFLEQFRMGNRIKAIADQRITPTLVDDIVYVLKVIIDAKAHGLYHISSKDSTTPLEFVKTISQLFNLDYSLIDSIKLDEYNKKKMAKLLKYSGLSPSKFESEFGNRILHTVKEGLVIFKQEIDRRS